jgi:hypothetical protein
MIAMADNEEEYADYCSGLAGLMQGLSDAQAVGISRLVMSAHMADDLVWEEGAGGALATAHGLVTAPGATISQGAGATCMLLPGLLGMHTPPLHMHACTRPLCTCMHMHAVLKQQHSAP